MTKLDKAKLELEEAMNSYASAKSISNQARTAEIEALNNLNNKQKAFDEIVGAIRSSAPLGSDWAVNKTLGRGS